jgi:micrococcal nuclease
MALLVGCGDSDSGGSGSESGYDDAGADAYVAEAQQSDGSESEGETTAGSGEDQSDEGIEADPQEAALPAEDVPPAPELVSAYVTRVIDGDTIEVSLPDGSVEKVRLIGVDTPESVHPDKSRNVPYGDIASAFTKDHLSGKTVGLEFDVQERDKYGRLLAYVYLGDIMFNELLVSEGHASVSTYPPNVKYVERFTAGQLAARNAGLGQWGYTPPEESAPDESAGGEYIGSARSYKFHYTDCVWGQKITSNNAVYFASRDEAIAAGFAPCKVCNP